MKIKLEQYFAKTESGVVKGPKFIIRLYPEINDEMAKLEWINQCKLMPTGFSNATNDGMYYSIIFEEKD
jgi:hypothetical protein